MMIEERFDSKIRDIVDSYQPTEVPASVWEGIESGLVRRRRVVLLRRIASAAAVAAVLFLGLLIYPFGQKSETFGRIADANILQETTEINTPSPLKSFGRLGVIVPKKAAPKSEPVVEAEVLPIEEQVANISTAVAENKTSQPKEQVVEQQTSQEQQQYIADVFAADQQFYEETAESKIKRSPIQIAASTNAILSGKTSLERGPMFVQGQSTSSQLNEIERLDAKHSLPITFGINLRIPLYKKLSLGTGVNFSILDSDYDVILNDVEGKMHQQLYYIGVPLTLNYEILNNECLSFYSFVGGAFEKGFQADYMFETVDGNSSNIKQSINGIQWSATLGMGLEYRFARFVGIYVDPSLVYYLENNQPISVRTDQPLQFRLELGFRFTL